MLVPFLSPPVQVTSFTAPTAASGPLQGESQGSQYLSFQFGGNWYQLVLGAPGAGPYLVDMYQSLDGGSTWAILNAGAGPSYTVQDSGPGAAVVSGNMVWVFYTVNGNLNTGGTDHIRIKRFNLATGLWVTTALLGPFTVVTLQAFARPDGSFLVISFTSFFQLSAHIFSGGSWTTTFAVDINLPAGFSTEAYAQAAMDAAGVVHVIIVGNDAVSQQTNLYEQQINPDNSLGSFTLITDWRLPDPGGTQGALFNTSPVILPDKILVGLQGSSTGDLSIPDYVTIAVGTPLNAPVWTIGLSPGIDGLTDPNFAEQSLSLATDGVTLFGAYVINSGATWQMRLLSTRNLVNPLAGWSSILAFDTGAAGVQNSINFLGIGVQNGFLFGSAVIPLAPASGPQPFWLGAQASSFVEPLSRINPGSLSVVPFPDPTKVCQ